jgi:hypothetical protein
MDGGAARRPSGPQLDDAGQLERALGDLGPVPKRQPATAFTLQLMESHQGVQAGQVNELKLGDIDDHRHLMQQLGVELAVKQRCGGVIKRAPEPQAQRVCPALAADRQLPLGDVLPCVANCVLARGASVVGLATRHQLKRRLRRARRSIALLPRRDAASCTAVRLSALALDVQPAHTAPTVGLIT